MSNTGNRRFKEDMIKKESAKIAEERREEQKMEHKMEGHKFNHKKN